MYLFTKHRNFISKLQKKVWFTNSKQKLDNRIDEEFSELTESEQMALFDAMKQDLFLEEPDKITKLLKTIREARFASGMACVHLARSRKGFSI